MEINIENAEIINLTPFDINIYDFSFDNPMRLIVTIETSGHFVGIAKSVKKFGNINDIPLTLGTKTVVGLPEPKQNTWYVVDDEVADLSPERTDLLVPNEPITGNKNKIIGYRSLAFPKKPTMREIIQALQGEVSVKTLITILKTFDPNDQVYFSNDDADDLYYYRMESIEDVSENSVVFRLS